MYTYQRDVCSNLLWEQKLLVETIAAGRIQLIDIRIAPMVIEHRIPIDRFC
jgi:hypothetical protein